MRYLILSDLHANLEALEAVQAATQSLHYDATVVLGDLVGYGASPDEVVERIRAISGPLILVRGNHDKVAAGLEETGAFNPIARASLEWTQQQLSEEQISYLRELPAGPIQFAAGCLACHGSPQDEDVYLLEGSPVVVAFEAAEAPLVLFGHTHIAGVLERRGERIQAAIPEDDGTQMEIQQGVDYLINPGAVGQPRDGDPRAAFGILDDSARRFTWHRIEYDIAGAQRRIEEAGLPTLLAERLSLGA